MVIALIALLTSVLVTGAIQLTHEQAVTPEDVFWRAVAETRRIALVSGHDLRMSYDSKGDGPEKSRALIVRSLDGSEKKFLFEQPGDLTVDFLPTQKSNNLVLIGGQAVDTKTIPYVTFFGDGTCSPFRLQIRTGAEARTLTIDPWTCSLVLPAATDQR